MSHPWREKLEALSDEEQARVVEQLPVMLEFLERAWAGQVGIWMSIRLLLEGLPLGWVPPHKPEARTAPAPRPSFPSGRGRFFPRNGGSK